MIPVCPALPIQARSCWNRSIVARCRDTIRAAQSDKSAQSDKRMSPSPNIFDRQLLRARQARASKLGPETFLLDRTASELGERLSAVLRQFDVAVDLGTPTDAVRQVLAASGKVGTIVAATVHPTLGDGSFLRVVADEEALPFAN